MRNFTEIKLVHAFWGGGVQGFSLGGVRRIRRDTVNERVVRMYVNIWYIPKNFKRGKLIVRIQMDTIASDTCQQYRTLHFKNINIYNWRQDSGWHCCVHIKNELIDIFIKS